MKPLALTLLLLGSLLAYSATDSEVVTITVRLHELTEEEEELLHKLCLLDKYKDEDACLRLEEVRQRDRATIAGN